MSELSFDWDDTKAAANRRKHGVSFDEAKTVFSDLRRLTAFDAEHSDDEDRWTAIGVSERLRVLVVTYVHRGGLLRIVTARRAVTWEREAYEKAAAKED